MLALLVRMRRTHLTAQGFRSTFRGWDANYSAEGSKLRWRANNSKIEAAQRSGEYCAEFAQGDNT